jgi:hypothetical protein
LTTRDGGAEIYETRPGCSDRRFEGGPSMKTEPPPPMRYDEQRMHWYEGEPPICSHCHVPFDHWPDKFCRATIVKRCFHRPESIALLCSRCTEALEIEEIENARLESERD